MMIFLANVEFVRPWVMALLPLPLLMHFFAAPQRERRVALRIPFFELAAQGSAATPHHSAVVTPAGRATTVVHAMAWGLLLLTASQPECVEPPLLKVTPSRDLFLAVDLSPSMREEDFFAADGRRIDRLSALRAVLEAFIARRSGDRIGLMVFAQQPFVLAPFTLDHAALNALLDDMRIGMAGGRTMIGDAIGLAIRVFEASEVPHRTLILLTDGDDSGSRVPVLKAAQIAAARGVRIHAVALGAANPAGQPGADFANLAEIARITGGQAFQAGDREVLESIYQAIDALETVDHQALSVRPRRPLHALPLGLALVLLLAWHVSAAVCAALTAAASERREAGLD